MLIVTKKLLIKSNDFVIDGVTSFMSEVMVLREVQNFMYFTIVSQI
jgi:hypothetical protein